MKKFSKNDIFYNELLTNPKYNITMYSGSLKINDQINQNQDNSSSINGIDYTGSYYYYSAKGGLFTGSYQYSSSISRSFIYFANSPDGGTFDSKYTQYSSLKKILAMKNIFKQYVVENKYSDIKYYLQNNGIPLKYFDQTNPNIKCDGASTQVTTTYCIKPTASINLIEIPRDFYGNYIYPGTVELNMYISGGLIATAKDVDKTGKLIQTYGTGINNVIGSIFYDYGILLITGAANLNTSSAPYIQPLQEYASTTGSVNDYLKWIYFGSYQNTIGSGIETKYELIFKGTNFIPTVTMMCHAEKNELFWSNNRTFIEAGQGDELFIGQSTSSVNKSGNVYYAASSSFLLPSDGTFKEAPMTIIKNTISSSFTHYSASYDPQVFISKIGIYDEEKNLIGIAKLANPVRKTKDLDYTFKLKLDL